MPQTVSSRRPPGLRMLKSMTSWLPGQEPVDVAVQPGGVRVGNTPIIGRRTPLPARAARLGMCPPSIIRDTSSMLAPSMPITMARFAGGFISCVRSLRDDGEVCSLTGISGRDKVRLPVYGFHRDGRVRQGASMSGPDRRRRCSGASTRLRFGAGSHGAEGPVNRLRLTVRCHPAEWFPGPAAAAFPILPAR